MSRLSTEIISKWKAYNCPSSFLYFFKVLWEMFLFSETSRDLYVHDSSVWKTKCASTSCKQNLQEIIIKKLRLSEELLQLTMQQIFSKG